MWQAFQDGQQNSEQHALCLKKKKNEFRSSHHGSVVMNRASFHEDAGSIPGHAQWVKDPMLP